MYRPSVFIFSYVPANVCHTTPFQSLIWTLSVLEGKFYHDFIHLPLGFDQFLKLGVAKRPSLTALWIFHSPYDVVEDIASL